MYKFTMRSVHRSIGVAFGLPVMVLCLTGALLTILHFFRSADHPLLSDCKRFLVTLHRWFYLPDHLWGGYLAGAVSLLLVVLVVSGIVLARPGRMKYAKNMFTFRFGHGYGLYNLHRVAGIYVSLWLSMLALTGTMWAFPAAGERVAGWIDVRHVPAADRYQEVPDEDGGVTTIDLDEEMDSYEKMMVWVGKIHLGKWGGGLGEAINLLVVIEGCVLVVTGYMLYFKRRGRRGGRR